MLRTTRAKPVPSSLRMDACPNSTETGCRCPDHHPGLLAYSNTGALEASLEKLRPVLRVVTMPTAIDEHPCAGTYCCDCPRCVHQRAQLMTQGSRDRPQPWTGRKAA